MVKYIMLPERSQASSVIPRELALARGAKTRIADWLHLRVI